MKTEIIKVNNVDIMPELYLKFCAKKNPIIK